MTADQGLRKPAAVPPRPYRTWSWKVAGVAAIVAGVIWFLGFTLPLFIPRFVDPTVSAVRVLHGTFGIIAMVTAVLQILPGVRRRFPLFHRWNGRVYVFLGVLPSAVLLVGVLFDMHDVGETALFFWGMVWIGTTAVAWVAARRRQYLKHRQWMTYSVAITLVAATNAGIVELMPVLTHVFSADVIANSLTWLPWVLHLAVAHWFIRRTTSVPYPRRKPREAEATQSA